MPATVTAVVQTRDGRLWVGTDTGLLQFDGERFEAWQPPANQQLTSDRITSLGAAPDGSLWIGTHGGLAHLSRGNLRNYAFYGSLAGFGASDVHIGRDGAVWVAAAGHGAGGVCKVSADRLECDNPPVGKATVYSIVEGRNQSLWVGGPKLWRWRPGPPQAFEFPKLPDDGLSVLEDREGRLWTGGAGLKLLREGRLVKYPLGETHSEPMVKPLLADRDGALWIGSVGQGLFRLYQGQIDHFSHANGLSGDIVFSLFEDREGNIWAGTDAGLDRFRENAVTMLSKRNGLTGNAISSLFPAKAGGAWVGTMNGLNWVSGDRVRNYGTQDGLPSGGITGIFEMQAGRLWVSTMNGLAYSDAAGFQRLDFMGRQIAIASAAEDSQHELWISDADRGLFRLDGTRVAEMIPWSKFRGRWAWSLEPDGAGLWMGFAHGEIAYYEPGRPPQWFQIPGKPATVLDLHKTAQGALWIATEAGLYQRVRGNIVAVALASPIPGNRIHGMAEDSQGSLWLKCASGLLRIARSELATWSADPRRALQVRVYDSGDGLAPGPPQTGCFRRAAYSKDGRLWFAFYQGLAMVDTVRLRENQAVPPIEIESMATADGKFSIKPGMRLPALTKEIRIDYTAFSYVAPEKVRFRYKLDGFDTVWHEVSGRQAVYTNLPPKPYRFRVIACNNDGVWNEAGAFWDFSIAPAYYQTSWFRALCGLAVALMLWMIHRWRLRQAAQRLSLGFQARLAERTRIAREIHDTLLQNLCGFALQLDALTKNAALPDSLRDRLREIHKETEQSMQDARKMVWDLRAPVIQEVDLTEVLRDASEQITGSAGIPLHLVVNGATHRQTMPAEFLQQMIRIVQEAARNAVRYSQAQQIQLTIEYTGSDMVRVQVRDDGCGFDPEEVLQRSGHWGLITMRERAQQIGGSLSISSAPGQGTEIDILAPIS